MPDIPFIEQPDVMPPDTAIDPDSMLPAGVGAPDDVLDETLEKLDPKDEAEEADDVNFEDKWDAHQDVDPSPDQPERSDTDTEDEPETEDQAEETEKPEEDSVARDELEKAMAALKRDGLGSDVIEKMTNSEIIELGLKRAKVQGDADNAYRELSELKKQQELAQESETESPANAEPTDQPVDADLTKAIQPFAEIFGDDAAQALSEYGKASMEPMMQAIQAQNQMLETLLMDSAKGKLQDRFPLLADDESYARVSTRMHSLAKTGEYSDVDNLMADAARIEFSDETKKVADEISSKRAQQKAVGQMTPAGGAETPTHSLSEEEREEKLLDALESGMPSHEARRLYGSAE